jgi:WD40 repeat protein
MCNRAIRISAALFVILLGQRLFPDSILAQETKLPTAEETRALQRQFRSERDEVIRQGLDKRFLPVLLEKAEEIGKRADTALAEGRLLQASEGYRQARWQLPYQSPQVPTEHVARILGNLRLRHAQEIHGIAFSPDGGRLVTASKDRTVKIWDLANGHELLSYTGHTDQVRHVAYSPDGRTIASAGAEPDIKLWDPSTGKDVRTIKGPGNYVTALAFGPDGKHLIVCSDNKQKALNIFEVATGNLRREMADVNITRSLAFSNDGVVLATGIEDGRMKLWEYAKITEANQPEYWAHQDPTGATYQAVFSPDKRTLARCGADGVKLYNAPLPGTPFAVSNPRRVIAPPDPKARFTCVTFSKDSKTIFTGGLDGLVRLWDAETGQPTGTFKGHNGEIKALAFNTSGSTLASASSDYTVRLWHFDIVLQSRDFTGHAGPVWSASFNPDGRRFVTASGDRTVKVWDVATGTVVHTLAGHKSGVTCALYSPDGKFILSAGGDKTLKLWDADSGKLVRTLEGHAGTVTALDFSADGTRIVSGSVDKKVKIWQTQDGKELISIAESPSIVSAVAFSPDGKQVASGHVDQTVRLWDAATGKAIESWAAHGTSVGGLAYSPNGQYLATCGGDHLVRVWPLATPGRIPITLSGHNGPLTAVAFRKDNQHLVSCGSDLVVKLWKLEGGMGKELQTFRGHKDWVSSAVFSKDGFYVASASVDRTVKIWEITSREIPLQSEHTGAVEAVAVSPDGKWIASGATDRTIKIWDRATGLEVRTLYGHTEAILSLTFTPDSKTLVSSSADRNVKLWNVADGKELPKIANPQNFTGFINPVPLILVPPQGGKLLTWVPGNERYTTISGFDLEGAELFTFNDTNRQVISVAFQADGRRAAVAARDGSVRIYDLEKKGQLLPGGDWIILDKAQGVGDLGLTPDGTTLIIGNGTGDVKICRIEGRQTLHTLKAHAQRVGAVAVSPDGKRFATVGFDNIIKLWDTASGRELRQWNLRAPVHDRSAFVTSVAFTPDGRHLVTANANTSLYVLELP